MPIAIPDGNESIRYSPQIPTLGLHVEYASYSFVVFGAAQLFGARRWVVKLFVQLVNGFVPLRSKCIGIQRIISMMNFVGVV